MGASVVASFSVNSTNTSAPEGSERLGEVIETNTTGFTAESDDLHRLPELGAIVRVGGLNEQQTYYGIVAFGETGGLDTSRRAVRRGSDSLSDEAIYSRHPELEYVLRTVFTVAVVGYRDGSTLRHVLPPLPVPLHFSVRRCTNAEVRDFVDAPRYFQSLLSYSGEITPEALTAAHLRWVDKTLGDSHEWLRDAVRRLARLMKRDYDRFVTIVQAAEPS